MDTTTGLRRWLDRSIENLPAGSRLPYDKDLAKTWAISHSTVRRVMSDYERKGLITRFKGKGSFTGTQPAAETAPPPAQPDAVQRLVEKILELIGTGELRQGEPLPTYKDLCINFRLSSATVNSAYRILRETGLVSRAGKYHWVGDFLTLARTRSRKEILFLYSPSTDLAQLFSTHEMALCLNKMEMEFFNAGYYLDFDTYANFPARVDAWIRSGHFPAGIVISGDGDAAVREECFKDLRHDVRRLIYNARISKPFILAISRGYQYSEPGVLFFSISHAITKIRRKIANLLFTSGFGRATVFLRDRHDMLGNDVTDALRLLPEIDRLNPSFDLSIVIQSSEKIVSNERFFERLYASASMEHFNSRLSKYRPIDIRSIEPIFFLVESFSHYFPLVKTPHAWIFSEDVDAVEALEWCNKSRITVPDEISIIGLENDHRFLRHGISTCIRDWEKMGYLIAHSVIGDIPIKKTSAGFIDYDALLLERRTTRH